MLNSAYFRDQESGIRVCSVYEILFFQRDVTFDRSDSSVVGSEVCEFLNKWYDNFLKNWMKAGPIEPYVSSTGGTKVAAIVVADSPYFVRFVLSLCAEKYP